MNKYDAALESFSRLIGSEIDYALNASGEMHIKHPTLHFYLGIDFTKIVEFFIWSVHQTLENDFIKELNFVRSFELSKNEINIFMDMPDRKLNNLISIIATNKGKLSIKKRKDLFSELTDREVHKIEKIIQKAFEGF